MHCEVEAFAKTRLRFQCDGAFQSSPVSQFKHNRLVTQTPFFQQKWSQLILVNNPMNQKPIGLELGGLERAPRDWGDAKKPGQYVSFSNGLLGTLSNDNMFPPPGTPLELTPPFAVYGGPYSFWSDQGGSKSKFGRPICDQQALADGGRCNIFEGGHIHFYNGSSQEYVSFSHKQSLLIADCLIHFLQGAGS
jgi:hypothetical protein